MMAIATCGAVQVEILLSDGSWKPIGEMSCGFEACQVDDNDWTATATMAARPRLGVLFKALFPYTWMQIRRRARIARKVKNRRRQKAGQR